MTQSRFAILAAFALAVTSFIAAPGYCIAVKYKTSGTYVDGAGGQHLWSVNDAHTLVWDDQPYVPVGVTFVPKSVASDASPDALQADTTALGEIKARGITDVVVKSPGPMSSTDPDAWQKLIDFLDSSGFAYGIEMADGPKDTLGGFLISPGRYRLSGPYAGTTISCDWPDVDSAIYVIVNTMDNTIKATGGAVVKDGKVSIRTAEPLASGEVLIVYPHETLKSEGIGDIWGGFGEYRDRMTGFLKKLKFGAGLRFFLEPFASKMDFTGEMIGLLPDSTGFRLGLEAYLTKKYVHEGSVNSGWGLNDNLDSIEAAARLMPLWSMGRGVSYVYDRASAKLISVDPSVTRMWRDIMDYRDTSAQEYMNTISDTLRKQVANVPVIFKSNKYHRIYANPYGMGGFDGLDAEAYGTGDAPVTGGAGTVYSLAEECGKSTWFITTTGAGMSGGYSSGNALAGALDSLREVGCKGFFLSDSGAGQIEWLAQFKEKAKPASLVDYKPTVVNYPIVPTTGAWVKRLAPNTWWLPTLKMGSVSFVGDGLSAYTILGEDRTYLRSSIGPNTITLKTPPTGLPSVEFPPNTPITKGKNGVFSVPLTDVPLVLKGMDISLVFPSETTQLEIDRLSAAIIEADKAGIGVKQAKMSVDRAKTVLKNGQALTAYGIAQQSLIELLAGLGSEVWIEAESSQAYSFDGPIPMQGASDGLALVLDTDQDPPLAPYTASLTFDAPSNSSYEVWIAGTTPSDGSPMTYSIEDSPWTPVTALDKTQSYAPGLCWYKIGVANLSPGKHSLKFRAEGRREGDRRYYFAVDAAVLSPRGFKPDGVIKPY